MSKQARKRASAPSQSPKQPRRRLSARPRSAEVPAFSTIVTGLLTREGGRRLLSIGGLSVEVLSTSVLPQDNAGLQRARQETASALAEAMDKTVHVRGIQSAGFLYSAKIVPNLGSTPAKESDRSRFARVEQVLAANRQSLLAIPGVIGVRPGYRFRDGWITDEPCIVAVVNQKTVGTDLPSLARIPDNVGGVDVDVAIASPMQQFIAQVALQGTAVDLDPINPEGFALPSGAQRVQAAAAEVFTAQLIRKSRYVPPPDLKLQPAHGPFTVTCHASPDAGWPVLSKFLDGIKQRVTIAMYDFTAPHIMRTLESAAADANANVSLILDPGQSLTNGDEPNNPKSGDFSEDVVRKDLEKKLQSHFAFVWAAVTRKGKVDAGFSIGISHQGRGPRREGLLAVERQLASSNQPDIDPLGPDRGLSNVHTMYNREWHVIVQEQTLAQTYEDFIKYDEKQAKPHNVGPQTAIRPDLFVPEELLAQAAADKYFAPRDINIGAGEVVQPLLTPDNYADNVLPLITSAKRTLYFQNQYIKISDDETKNPPKFAALVDALREKIDGGVDVRIILRDIGDTRPMLEALKTNGFDMSHVRLQKSCHNKGIIVDGEVVLLGSHNWSGDGTVYNRDASLIFHNRDVAQYFQTIFLYDWDNLARQKASAESAMPRLALSGEEPPEGSFRIPWESYFGEYQADLQNALGSIDVPAAPRRVTVLSERAQTVTPKPGIQLLAAQSQVVVGDLQAAKAELSSRYLRPGDAKAFRAQAATTSPDPAINVVGVGIGEKESEGLLTGLMSVRLLVRVKYPKNMIASGSMLPPTIGGLPVDVQETGTFRAFAGFPDPRVAITPAQPGCSIGFEFPDPGLRMAGTLGAVVRDAAGKRYILSNNHVLADESRLPAGAPIFQTGLLDLPAGAVQRQIARLSKFIPFNQQALKIDCAIAEEVTPNILSNQILYIGAPKGTAPAKTNMAVHKFGRTTAYRAGTIRMVSTDVTVSYETGSFVFEDQIVIVGANGAAFSDAGDSGSLILERESQMAVGLLFAGSPSHTLANHIDDVLQALGVTLET